MANNKLFLDDYTFKGYQSDEVVELTKTRNDPNGDFKIFTTTVELFIFSAYVGCFYNEKAKPQTDNSRISKIIATQFNTHSDELKIAFQMITLFGNYQIVDKQERLNNTFRYPDRNENYDNFEQYMLGGLDYIYKKLINDSNKIYQDYLNGINKLMSDISNFTIIEDATDVSTNDFVF